MFRQERLNLRITKCKEEISTKAFFLKINVHQELKKLGNKMEQFLDWIE